MRNLTKKEELAHFLNFLRRQEFHTSTALKQKFKVFIFLFVNIVKPLISFLGLFSLIFTQFQVSIGQMAIFFLSLYLHIFWINKPLTDFVIVFADICLHLKKWMKNIRKSQSKEVDFDNEILKLYDNGLKKANELFGTFLLMIIGLVSMCTIASVFTTISFIFKNYGNSTKPEPGVVVMIVSTICFNIIYCYMLYFLNDLAHQLGKKTFSNWAIKSFHLSFFRWWSSETSGKTDQIWCGTEYHWTIENVQRIWCLWIL